MATTPVHVRIAHAIPGRSRLRIHPAPLDTATAEAVAGRLAAEPGIIDVEVNRLTGSVRCRHHDRLGAPGLLEAVLSALPGSAALCPGQAPPPPAHLPSRSAVARAVAQAFSGVNKEVLAATNGSLDLGTIAALGFAGTGAIEVAVKGNLPAPPWFNLAWWAFRTFITFEAGAAAAPAPHPRSQDEQVPA
jgi:hypothetical protein